MQRLIFSILFIIPTTFLFSQEIGELVPPKPPMNFPDNALGFDLLIGESGFGFGGFYRRQLNTNLTLFGDVSISEAKDEREIEYIDIYGQTFTFGKQNRVCQIPFTLGAQYRFFEKELTDNLRPYISAGIGPTIALTTPAVAGAESLRKSLRLSSIVSLPFSDLPGVTDLVTQL